MGGYKPIHITGNTQGLIQSREEFIIPHDAYPVLQNAFVWRERVLRKQGNQFVGRLRRFFSSRSQGNSGVTPWTFSLYSSITTAAAETNKEIEPGSVSITFAGITFEDQGDGTLDSTTPNNSGTIDYMTGSVTLTHTAGSGHPAVADFGYFPALPCMGVRMQETASLITEATIFFDTVYAYKNNGTAFQEFIPGTTWKGDDSDFFFSTNYWYNGANKLFWVTNFSGPSGDPIRYTDGSTWTDFTPQLDSTGSPQLLTQSLALLPFRGRLLAFNTWEGTSLAASSQNAQRIRWSVIGDPTNAMTSWLTTPGSGGYLDIPTSEAITAVGYVRDNLVIYCERSTWQLRYTGRSIQPFLVEKINAELGAASAFSAVQFDTSLVGIGDKGIVRCDSYKSERIDLKIPDLVFTFNNDAQGPQRVCGFRDFYQRIAYWMYPYIIEGGTPIRYPNRRLIYNYENDSWGIYIDQFTALGNFQPPTGISWDTEPSPVWERANFAWNIKNPSQLEVAGGNQQGFISLLDYQTMNDPSLAITNITGGTTGVIITIPNHTLDDGQVIRITGIIGDFSSLNDQNYAVSTIDENTVYLQSYSADSKDFTQIVVVPVGAYIGGGRVALRDNMVVQSKKFSFMDEGQNIQVGYLDLLCPATENGAVTLYVLLNYNETSPINVLPENVIPATGDSDSFFNTTVSTSNPSGNIAGTKYMQRVYCPVRGTFLTFVWAYSPEQMNGAECEEDFQIDAQVLWMRPAGRMTNS
jgi:hypothetical protein